MGATSAHTVTVRILNLKLPSPNRRRGHTRLAAIIHSKEVEAIRWCVQLHVAAKNLRRCGRLTDIRFVRIAPKRMDADNFIAATKPAIDGAFRALRIDDRDLVIAEDRPGIRATFEQRAEGTLYALEIVLTFGDAA